MRTTSSSAAKKPASGRKDHKWRPGGTLGRNNSAKRSGGAHAGRGGSKAGPRRVGTAQSRQGRVPEWAGIQSDDEPGGEDDGEEDEVELTGREGGSSPEPMEEEDAPAVAAAPAGAKAKPQRKKASGPGKQKKVFVEEKGDLMALVASIAGKEEAKTKAKLRKTKQRPSKPAPAPKQQVNPAKQKQLDAARAVVAARSKAKKDKQKADTAPKPAPAAAEGKKRVSFA
ncbi:hypothetical protein JCM6882_005795 [Rhodosporidiobolus microsporus]